MAFLLASTIGRAETYSNGNLVTHPGVGAGGADVSAISADTRGATFGFNVSTFWPTPGPFFLADDVTPDSSWRLNKFHAFAFMPAATAPNVDRAYLCIFDGDPEAGGSIIFGSLQSGINNNRLESTSFDLSVNGRPIYRTANATSSASNTQRQMQDVKIRVDGDVILEAGRTYWFAWSLGATTASSTLLESAPLAGNRGGTANAKHYFANGSPLHNGSNWGPAALNYNNIEGSRVDFPFELEYAVVPEPMSAVAFAVGVGCLGVFRNKRK